jgi:hypothetical protein
MTAPFEPGDFAWTNFPFEADPNHPGPGRHAALIMATFATREAAQISAPVPLQNMCPSDRRLRMPRPSFERQDV